MPKAILIKFSIYTAACGFLATLPAFAENAPLPTAKLQERHNESATFPLCRGAGRVTCVVDGDTIWYRGTKIRIADIDAPEVRQPRCDGEAKLGHQATLRLQSLLNAAPFRLEPSLDGRATDRYGRALKVIKRGDISLGSLMVREGLARHWNGYRESWC